MTLPKETLLKLGREIFELVALDPDKHLESVLLSVAAIVCKRVDALRWQGMESAPKDGKPVLLAIEPIDSYVLLGWRPERFVAMAIGWWSGSEWSSALMEEGTADSEGHSSPMAISINPTHWAPLPRAPQQREDEG